MTLSFMLQITKLCYSLGNLHAMPSYSQPFHSIWSLICSGKQPVDDLEVINHYHGTHVPIENLSGFHGTVRIVSDLLWISSTMKLEFFTQCCLFQGSSMHQLMDLFALPEMALFSNVIQVTYYNSSTVND